jgi:hypothetical protein
VIWLSSSINRVSISQLASMIHHPRKRGNLQSFASSANRETCKFNDLS